MIDGSKTDHLKGGSRGCEVVGEQRCSGPACSRLLIAGETYRIVRSVEEE
jgi:hypothetical protein